MTETADLEHMFQLEQILSLGSPIQEWSGYGDDSNDSAANMKNRSSTQSQESISQATDPKDNSTTSFDPGGDPEVPAKIGGGEEGDINENSKILHSHCLVNSPNTDNSIS